MRLPHGEVVSDGRENSRRNTAITKAWAPAQCSTPNPRGRRHSQNVRRSSGTHRVIFTVGEDRHLSGRRVSRRHSFAARRLRSRVTPAEPGSAGRIRQRPARRGYRLARICSAELILNSIGASMKTCVATPFSTTSANRWPRWPMPKPLASSSRPSALV